MPNYIDQQIDSLARSLHMWIPDIRRVTEASFGCGCVLEIAHAPAFKVRWTPCGQPRHQEFVQMSWSPEALAIEIQREYSVVIHQEGPKRHLGFGAGFE